MFLHTKESAGYSGWQQWRLVVLMGFLLPVTQSSCILPHSSILLEWGRGGGGSGIAPQGHTYPCFTRQAYWLTAEKRRSFEQVFQVRKANDGAL